MAPPRLILFHGLSSTPQEFGLMAHGLKARGIDYQAVTVPQYTLGQQSGAPAWREWTRQAVAVVANARQDDAPVILGGLCVGGMLAAALAQGAVPNVAGLIMMSPTFVFDGWGVSPTRHLRHIAYATGLDAWCYMREREPYGIKNLRMRQWIKKELDARAQSAVGPQRISLAYLRESERLTRVVRAGLATLKCPIMILHAKADELCRLSSVEAIFSELTAPRRELVVLDDSYHMITIDNDRAQVVNEIDRFIRVNVSGAAGARAYASPQNAAMQPYQDVGAIAA